ncbi:MAG: sensor histidine kinase KdpD [Methylococcaceae bacterium]|nr:sensor histidine kinase KdpD [Methylococcaceae bacterium]
MSFERPDPDVLLAKIAREQAKARRGRLKIFFGAAAGVGKTYTMLQAARGKRAEGTEVVVGLVESHGRKETEELQEGLEPLPCKLIQRRGAVLREFDLDGALKRRPALILVDELAHTNAPGSRHPKRWQDIDELLAAGIDVYTTLNVQHLESLNDDVGLIAGIKVWETVPDTVFEQADEVELVDLPPDELLVRLREGKVYLPDQAQMAIQHFFRKGNLIALRELALRRTAERVDAQMRDYRDDHAIREVWQVSDRILVCIGPNLMAERLIRAGKRLAAGLRAEWIAVYVETPRLQRLPSERRDAVLRLLRQAEQLGAETATLSAPDMSEAIIQFAKERNVTKIVMGKPSRRGLKRWLMGSVVDTIIGHAHNVNVYLLGSPRDDGPEENRDGALHGPALPGFDDKPGSRRTAYRGYLWGIATITLCTLFNALLVKRFELSNLIMVYLMGVIHVATKFGRGPSILASILSVVCFDLFFATPYLKLSLSDIQYLVTLAAMLTVAMVISHLMANVRAQAKVAAHRERRATVLYAMSKELSASRNEMEIIRCAVLHLYMEFGGPNVVLFPNSQGRIVYPRDDGLPESLHGADLDVAQWVFDHGEMAGQGTHTLPGSKAVYFPLTSLEGTIGVLALLPVNLRRIFLPEQRKLLETFINQLVQAIARVRLAENAKTTQIRTEVKRLRNDLLRSISHDMRSPLATIVGSSSTLLEHDDTLNPADRRELSRAILEEAMRMSNLANNILDMAKFESGAMQLNRQWYPLEDIIGTVLGRLAKRLEQRSVKVEIPSECPLLYLDSVLIEQVLFNLLDNSARYTPEGTPIEISAELQDEGVIIKVSDQGGGIPPGQEDMLFEKFFRVHQEKARSGVGLGLAISRTIVEAHGGYIHANNKPHGGAVFYFFLPTERCPPSVELAEAQTD